MVHIDFQVSNLSKGGTIELHFSLDGKKKSRVKEKKEAEECYLSTGELKPLGGPELPCSMLLDTAILYE